MNCNFSSDCHVYRYISIIVIPLSTSTTATGNQTVGQPLTLEFTAIDVNCDTATVEFVWSIGGVQLKQTKGTGFCFRYNNSSVCKDTYNISVLSTSNDGGAYRCDIIAYHSPPVTATSSITLRLNGMANVIVLMDLKCVCLVYTQFLPQLSPHMLLCLLRPAW